LLLERKRVKRSGNFWMKFEIITTPTFDKEFKRLKKKYNSLPNDLEIFEKELLGNTNIGIDLGGNIRKVRVAVKSKNKGKSSGIRVITYSVIFKITDGIIFLVTLFDKSERENISDSEIKQIIKEIGF
jgi:hypothetical protein